MKFPQVERDPMTNGVKGKSAIAVYEFLAEEADFEGDTVRAGDFQSTSQTVTEYLARKCLG
jgi:hypothetical protein